MSHLNLDLPPEIQAEEAGLLLAIKLWEAGRLSLGQSAALAGYSKRAFMEILGRNGLPVLDYSPDELDSEINQLGD